jgi:ABC-type lipoprotein release transport system permease subunit
MGVRSIVVLAAVGSLAAGAVWKGLVGVLLVVGGALALLVVVALLAGLAAVASAFLPVARVPVRYNLRNLQARWKSTLATALAFTLVVGLLTVMLAFVRGMDRLTEGSGQAGNVVVLSQGAVDESFSDLPPGISVFHLPKDVQELVRRDRGADGGPGKFWSVKEIYAVANQELPQPEGGEERERSLQIRGVDDPHVAGKVHGIELEKGTWFSPSGVNPRTGRSEIVLGDGIARVLGADRGGGPLGPGDSVTMGPRQWVVTGVMKPSGSVFGSEIWAKDELVARYFGNVKDGAIAYTSFVVRVKDPVLVRPAARRIRAATAQGTFEAFPEEEYYSKQSQTSRQFLGAVVAVALVMAFGGVLGIMNTMFAAVSQRTKDIGVLRLLGFTRRQILQSFLLESVVIALLGGLVGCGLGALAHGWTATSIVTSETAGEANGKVVVFRLVVDGSIVAAGMLFTLVMGAAGGLIPGAVAMRLRPLESLRQTTPR